LTTRHGLFPSPLTTTAATTQVLDWCSAPGSVIVSPTPRHGDVLSGLLSQVGAGGNLVNDAHLAALAIEHRAGIVSYDSDFGRFEGVRWETPGSLLEQEKHD
jgi:uncharacterized protein